MLLTDLEKKKKINNIYFKTDYVTKILHQSMSNFISQYEYFAGNSTGNVLYVS